MRRAIRGSKRRGASAAPYRRLLVAESAVAAVRNGLVRVIEDERVKAVAIDARTVVTTVPFVAAVVSCRDGDTVKLRMPSGATVFALRCRKVDAPELAQRFGRAAKTAAVRLLAGKTVHVIPHGGDAFGRVLGEITLPDGRDYGQVLVGLGLAWWYNRYAIGDVVLARLEDTARRARRGLWRDPSPVPPWVYRRGKGRPK